MPFDPNRRIMTPDFYPESQQGWIPMGDDQDQPIDAGPAVSAFKQRFMGGGAPEHGGGLPMHPEEEMPMGMEHGGPLAGGTHEQVKPKSL
jgi:hypothetical protein